MTGDVNIIRSLVMESAALLRALNDISVRHVTIAHTGRWAFEKLGRVRHEAQLLDSTVIAKLAEHIPTAGYAAYGEWAIRRYPGQGGSLLFFERLPVAIADRLPAQVLSDLQRQIRFDGNGLVVGPPGSGKSSLLLWLALQIPDDDVLLVSECPPQELPGPNVRHVFPPNTTAERRALERLVRVAGNVIWERLHTIEDFTTFGCAVSARRAWFTTDAPTLDSALIAYLEAANRGSSLPLTTIFALQPSAIGRPETVTLLTEGPDGWTEKHNKDVSYLPLVSHLAEPMRRLRSGEHPSVRASDIYATFVRDEKYVRDEATGMISADSLMALRGEAKPSLDLPMVEISSVVPMDPTLLQEIRGEELELSSSVVIGDEGPMVEKSVPEVTRQYVNTPRVLNAMVDKPAFMNGSNPPERTNETSKEKTINLGITRGNIATNDPAISAEFGADFGDDFAGVLDSESLDFDSFVEDAKDLEPFASVAGSSLSQDMTPTSQNEANYEAIGQSLKSGLAASLPKDVDETHLSSIPDSLPPFQWLSKEEDYTDELTFAQKLDRLRRKRDNN